MLTMSLVLSLIALLLAIGSAVERVPLWVPVVLLATALLVQAIPVAR
jgi:hypothetical protein